jgi:outer membrane protein
MKSSKYLLAAGALLALVASPALAYEAGTWVLRAGVGVVAPDSDNFVDDDGVETTTVTVDDGTSLTLMGTYMFSPNWGFDILASWPFRSSITSTRASIP